VFFNTIRVTDRFHVQKLDTKALQEIRIKHRWLAIDQENEALEKAKKSNKSSSHKYLPIEIPLSNYWPKAVISYIKTTLNGLQTIGRTSLLFELYPAYNVTQELRGIFENTRDKIIGFAKLAKWYEKVNQSGFKSFNTISRTIMNHYQTILNCLDNRVQMWQNLLMQK
jgi:transposase